MSEPTYRIEIEHDPHSSVGFDALIFRVADDVLAHRVYYCSSAEKAQTAAIEWVKIETANLRQFPAPVYVTEDGEIVPAPEPQSLRA